MLNIYMPWLYRVAVIKWGWSLRYRGKPSPFPPKNAAHPFFACLRVSSFTFHLLILYRIPINSSLTRQKSFVSSPFGARWWYEQPSTPSVREIRWKWELTQNWKLNSRQRNRDVSSPTPTLSRYALLYLAGLSICKARDMRTYYYNIGYNIVLHNA